MKSTRSILLLLAIVLALISCDDFLDDDCHHHHYRNDYWIAMGTIEGDNNSYIVETDGNNRLYPKESYNPVFDILDGQRVWINYTILGTSRDNEEIDYYVRINRLKKILTKGIFELTPENSDSIGYDPISIKRHWIVDNYLNVKFSYKGGRTVHYINLARNINEPETPEGMPILEIKHNANNDPAYHYLTGFVSFDISELKIDGEQSVDFLLRAIGNSGGYEFEEVVTYDY